MLMDFPLINKINRSKAFKQIKNYFLIGALYFVRFYSGIYGDFHHVLTFKKIISNTPKQKCKDLFSLFLGLIWVMYKDVLTTLCPTKSS